MKKFIFLGFLCIGFNIFAESFVSTCQNLEIIKASLSAECRALNGGIYKTALRLRGINNHNGVLTIEEDSTKMSRFHKTCQDCAIDSNGILAGRCKNDKGQFVWSYLDLSRLIINYNGTLVYPIRQER